MVRDARDLRLWRASAVIFSLLRVAIFGKIVFCRLWSGSTASNVRGRSQVTYLEGLIKVNCDLKN